MATSFATPARPDALSFRWPTWTPAVIMLAIVCAFGAEAYVGGGGDDYYYLDAARCLVRGELCLPHTHWAARWPVVAPLAAAIALFGESLLSVALPTIAYTAAAAILLALNVERRLGRSAGAIAALVLVLTPAMTGRALKPAPDGAELAWLLAALLAIQLAIRHRSSRAALSAGLLFALAIMTRTTAVVLLPVVAVIGWRLPDTERRLAIPFVIGLAAPLLAEMACYALATGNPGYGLMLALHHARLPTSELPPGIDLTQGTLFNLDLIRHWHRSSGIHVHWLVDPLLNLLADPAASLTLLGAGALALVARDRWTRADRWLLPAIAAAAGHFLVITYVLAIDPKPRMFLPELALAATMVGIAAGRLLAAGRVALPVALLALLALRGISFGYGQPNPIVVADTATAWIRAEHNPPATDEWTRRSLALAPVAAALPIAVADERRPILALSPDDCAAALDRAGPGWRVERFARFTPRDPPVIGWLRAHGIMIGAYQAPTLCLLRPPDRAASPRA